MNKNKYMYNQKWVSNFILIVGALNLINISRYKFIVI